MKISMTCGPTCGCGKTYEVEADGRKHNCPHCGKFCGRSPAVEKEREKCRTPGCRFESDGDDYDGMCKGCFRHYRELMMD